MDELRKKLLGEMKTGGRIDARGLKPHQVHELAAAKLGMFSGGFSKSSRGPG